MPIQKLNYNKDKDIKDEDLNLVKPIFNSVYETFIKRNYLAVSDDMNISIIHTNKEKEDELF